jgi:N-acetylglutamate synthase-like GNAT family acetyltransferase
MKIRKGKESDIGIISDVIQKSYATVAQRYGLTLENCPKHPSNCTAEWIVNDMDRGVAYFVAESGKTVIGCIAIEKATDETCYLERLSVIPDERNQGVGLKLVTFFIDEAERLGYRKIGIGLIAKQHDLKLWYQRIGFAETGKKTFDHLPFDVAFMEYDLKDTAPIHGNNQ